MHYHLYELSTITHKQFNLLHCNQIQEIKTFAMHHTKTPDQKQKLYQVISLPGLVTIPLLIPQEHYFGYSTLVHQANPIYSAVSTCIFCIDSIGTFYYCWTCLLSTMLGRGSHQSLPAWASMKVFSSYLHSTPYSIFFILYRKHKS